MNQKAMKITLTDGAGFEYKYLLLGKVYGIYYVVQPEGKNYREVIRVDSPEADVTSGVFVRDEDVESSVLAEYRAIEEEQRKNASVTFNDAEKEQSRENIQSKSKDIEVDFSVPHSSECSEYNKERNYYDRSRNRDDSACRELELEKKRMADKYYGKKVAENSKKNNKQSKKKHESKPFGGDVKNTGETILKKIDRQPDVKLPGRGSDQIGMRGKTLSVLIWLIIIIIGMAITNCDESYIDYGDDSDYCYYLETEDLDSPYDWVEQSDMAVKGYVAYVGDDYITVFVGKRKKLPKETQLVNSSNGCKAYKHCVIVNVDSDDELLDNAEYGQTADIAGSTDSQCDTVTVKGEEYDILNFTDVMGWSCGSYD